jgi:hypothetical protein
MRFVRNRGVAVVSTPFKQERKTREERYEQMRARVADFTDALGKPLDAGIFETVVYLNLLGTQTTQSCEGHLDHGCPYPWVTLIDDERSRQFHRAWREVCSLEERTKASASVEAFDAYLSAESDLRALIAQWEAQDTCLAHFSALLEDFYTNRATNAARLVIKRLQPGTYRLEPGFSRVAAEMPAHLKARYLLLGQAEMQDFTVYLKQRFFA